MYKKTQKLALISAVLITSPSLIQSEERTNHSKYTFHSTPLKADIRFKDLRYLKYLPKTNPTITFTVTMDKDPKIMTWPYDIVGAITLLATIFYHDDDHNARTAKKAAFSALVPLLPRLYNYIITSNPQPSELPSES